MRSGLTREGPALSRHVPKSARKNGAPVKALQTPTCLVPGYLRSFGARLAAAGVHFEVGVAAQFFGSDEGAAGMLFVALLGAAVVAGAPTIHNYFGDAFARKAFAQRAAQVRALCGVEAAVPHAVGGEATAVAVAAEGRGGGGDDA